MSVAPVPGYGYITQSNAADIYKDKTTYDGLTPAQKHLVDRYVPQETRDEIDYESGRGTQNAYEEGKGTIEDADKAENSKSQTANVAATTGGNIAAVATTAMIAAKCFIFDGFSEAVAGAVSLAAGVASIFSSKAFDSEYKNRTDANDNAGSTNETLDNHSAALESTMDSMDEDVQTYQEQQELLTNTTNNNASTGADLQAQIMDAEAAGDGERVKSLKEQLKAVGDFDYSQMQGDLDETKAKLDEYNDCNAMAMGASAGGQSVADFLGEGRTLGTWALVNAVVLGLATALLGTASAGCAPKIGPFFPDGIASALGRALYAGAAAAFGMSTKTMVDKTNKEYECGSSGSDMQEHVNNLNSMIENQQTYIDQTDEDFTTSDDEAAETIAKGEEHAAQVVAKAAEMSAEEKTNDKVENNEGNGSPTNQNA